MAAYMVIIAEIHDRESFMAYAVEAAKLVEKMGGTYHVQRPIKSECLEGQWPDTDRLVISKWPSFEAAKDFWHSPEYNEVKKLRAGNSTVRVRLVEELSALS
ncbi:DUF1330 domain-containing protein [Temperatibacter marinus]|uniref:DUF1330 domain-containing protein n=1 Tax=Temperatibacter marinus TaxID=1456591 RepID=A0AA52EJN3_9PROT|nr:DUF1330 domain-containing protein [Temperatibacter marinus]WND03494.1 DUF1330 domain-containing protein [Temperatibacter marinus]